MERAALGFRLKASHVLVRVRSEELGVRSGGAAQKIMKRREYIWGDARKSYEMTPFSYRQPSPRGEGAPQGRIGHKRYEKEWERASQAGDLRKHPIHRFAVPLPHAGKAHRWRLRRNIYGAMPALDVRHQMSDIRCLPVSRSSSHQPPVPSPSSPQKTFLKIFLDPVTCDRVRRKDLLHLSTKIGHETKKIRHKN